MLIDGSHFEISNAHAQFNDIHYKIIIFISDAPILIFTDTIDTSILYLNYLQLPIPIPIPRSHQPLVLILKSIILKIKTFQVLVQKK